MTNQRHLIRLLGGLLLGLIGVAEARTSNLDALQVEPTGRRVASQQLISVLPPARHILVFVDVTSAQSQSFLPALQRDGFPGYRTTIVLLARDDQAQAGAIDLKPWQNAQVVHGDLGSAKSLLGLTGFPAVIAVDEAQHVVWRRVSPRQREMLPLVNQMLDWLR